MTPPSPILSTCKIADGRIVVDGTVLFKADGSDFQAFAKAAYQQLGIAYPKFYKMDRLGKLAFLAAEVLLGRHPEVLVNDGPAVVFANRSSSLDTDVVFQQSIADPENHFPSPAVFVYTLPNICVGEISIRHQLKSANYFFILDTFDSDFLQTFAEDLMVSAKADFVLCGWVECFGNDYTANMWLTGAGMPADFARDASLQQFEM
jgi:hypothetical protein